jgi:hypothetical protein
MYFEAKSCWLPLSTEYFAIVSFFSAHHGDDG